MNTLAKVYRFHLGTGDVDSNIRDPKNRLKLIKRLDLITEEKFELEEAVTHVLTKIVHNQPVKHEDIQHLIKELADLKYVVDGFAVEFGIDLDDAYNRVHQSNMTKFDPLTGKPYETREDGKVLKGPYYAPPSMASVSYVGDTLP